jgi:hypothetical protein
MKRRDFDTHCGAATADCHTILKDSVCLSHEDLQAALERTGISVYEGVTFRLTRDLDRARIKFAEGVGKLLGVKQADIKEARELPLRAFAALSQEGELPNALMGETQVVNLSGSTSCGRRL